MDRSEFLKQEYLTLRREIYATKDRIFKIMGFGLVVVPSSHLLAETLEIEMVTYSLPLLVIVVALIFLAENNALMRCGHYIKNIAYGICSAKMVNVERQQGVDLQATEAP